MHDKVAELELAAFVGSPAATHLKNKLPHGFPGFGPKGMVFEILYGSKSSRRGKPQVLVPMFFHLSEFSMLEFPVF